MSRNEPIRSKVSKLTEKLRKRYPTTAAGTAALRSVSGHIQFGFVFQMCRAMCLQRELFQLQHRVLGAQETGERVRLQRPATVRCSSF